MDVLEVGVDGGRGESTPSRRVTGYGVEDCPKLLERWWGSRDVSGCPRTPAKAPFAGLDAALLDRRGREEDRPLHDLLELPAARVPTSMTVSLAAPEAMVEEAGGFLEEGFTHLKVKVGEGPEDVDRIEALRDAYPAATIRVDANGGWSRDEAVEIFPALSRLDVELVEQPLPPGRDDAVADLDGPPVYADESVVDPGDLDDVADAYDGVVAKVNKHGGPRPTRDLLADARARGLQTMIGCNIASSLTIAAATHLLDLVDRADLDGALLLSDDAYAGIPVEEGRIGPPEGPGLGVREVGP